MDHVSTKNSAVYGAILLVLVYIGRIQELFKPLESIQLGKIAIAVGLILLLRNPTREDDIPLLQMSQVRCLLLILVAAAASVPFSVWPANSFNILIDSYKMILFVVIIIKSVVEVGDIRKVLWGTTFALFLLSLKAVLLERVGRVSVSTTYDPNDLAYIIVSLFPISYYMAKEETGGRRLFLLATLALSVMTIVLTASRGGFIGFVVVIVAILYKEKRNLHRMLVPAALIGGIVLWFAPGSYWERMGSSFDSSDYNYASTSTGRMSVWKDGVGLMLSNPVLGVGLAGFETAYGMSHGGVGKWSSSHNSFIQIGAELGLPGLILFVMLLRSSVKSIQYCRSMVPSAEKPYVLNGIEVSFYGYMAAGFFLSQAYSSVIFFLVSMTIIQRKFCERELARRTTGAVLI